MRGRRASFSEQFGKAMPPKGARALRGVVLRTRTFLADCLREAAALGQVRRDVPADMLAVMVMGVMFARTLLASLADEREAPPPSADDAWSSLLALLVPPAPAPDRPTKEPHPAPNEGAEP